MTFLALRRAVAELFGCFVFLARVGPNELFNDPPLMTLTSTAQSDKYTKNKQQANITQNQQNQNQQRNWYPPTLLRDGRQKKLKHPAPPPEVCKAAKRRRPRSTRSRCEPSIFSKDFLKHSAQLSTTHQTQHTHTHSCSQNKATRLLSRSRADLNSANPTFKHTAHTNDRAK